MTLASHQLTAIIVNERGSTQSSREKEILKPPGVPLP